MVKVRCQDCGKIDECNKNEIDEVCCDECGEEIVCQNCMIEFENIGSICKPCIDKAYPSRIEPKIEYKEKIVEKVVYVDKEGTLINTSFNPNNKTKFD